VRERPDEAIAAEARRQEGIGADQPQARPLRQPECEVIVDRARGGEDEEHRREARAEHHRAGVGQQLPQLRTSDWPAGSRLRTHELAVDLRQGDRDRRADQVGRHRRGARRVGLESNHERQPDDRAVDHPGDVSRAEMGGDRASHRGTVVPTQGRGKGMSLPIAECTHDHEHAGAPVCRAGAGARQSDP
jgi:hypothetical protein